MTAIHALVLIFVVPLIAFASIMLSFVPIWIQVYSSGVSVSFARMIGMKLRGLSPQSVCQHLIALHKAGLKIDSEKLEAHMLAGGLREAKHGVPVVGADAGAACA